MLDGAKLFMLSVSHSIIQIVFLSSQSRIDCCSPARRCCSFLDKQETRPTQVRLKKRFQLKPPRLPSTCKKVTSGADANNMLAAQTCKNISGLSLRRILYSRTRSISFRSASIKARLIRSQIGVNLTFHTSYFLRSRAAPKTRPPGGHKVSHTPL